MENEGSNKISSIHLPNCPSHRHSSSMVSIDSKSARHTLINEVATGPEVGPGKYDERRTNFLRTNKYGELVVQDWKKCKPQYSFKSHSPRIRPFLLSDAPLPGKYESASFAGEVLKKNAKLKPLKLNKSKKLKSPYKV